jgi:hypothetical protein
VDHVGGRGLAHSVRRGRIAADLGRGLGVAALVGLSTFLYTLVFGDVGWVTAAAAAAPALFAGLWGRQYGAGLIAGLTVPWLLPPTVLAMVGYAIYWALERTAGAVLTWLGRAPHDPGTMAPEGM